MSIVLDMDETLVHCFSDIKFLEDPNFKTKLQTFSFRLGDGSQIWGVCRPGLGEFLKYVTANFENVFIWSAGTDEYVVPIIRIIFNMYNVPAPKMILTRRHCRIAKDETYHKPMIDLKNIWYVKHGKVLDLNRIFIVDDRHFTFLMNPFNGIQIPPFHPGGSHREKLDLQDMEDSEDWSLEYLINWFEDVNIKDAKEYISLTKPWLLGPQY